MNHLIAKKKYFKSAFVMASSILLLASLVFVPATAGAIGYNDCIVSIYCDTDYFDWRGGTGSKYTERVKSLDGQVCVTTNFNSYNLSDLSYRWAVQVFKDNRWQDARTSEWYGANGNVDKQCFDNNVYRGHHYRARFWPAWPGGFVHGDATIYGYKTTQGPLRR